MVALYKSELHVARKWTRETSFVHLLCTQTHKDKKRVGIIICLVIFTGVATKSQTSLLIKRSRKNNEYFVVQVVNWGRQNSEKEIKLELGYKWNGSFSTHAACCAGAYRSITWNRVKIKKSQMFRWLNN